ncbi:MAG: type II toxin-antitoxin system PemK/MazF family toxin [Candidatus Tectomicrobia bacterium]|nr:type II toxin-antitoxin system PemK/MazF family toxin [Candidatus Tectomicrobia bacterium]
MMQAGDVVLIDFPGVTEVKNRPAIVVSTDLYHNHRSDIIIALVTTQIASATAPTDYVLQDWAAAGLRRPSVSRSFLATVPARRAVSIGRLSDRDWQEVQACLKLALAVP